MFLRKDFIQATGDGSFNKYIGYFDYGYNTLKRREAIQLGLSSYFTGKPCRRGHVAERKTKSGNCVSCQDDDRLLYKEWQKHANQLWRLKNPEYNKIKLKEWRLRHPDKKKLYNKKWKSNHPEACRGYCAKRRAMLLNRSPNWLSETDKQEISLFYKKARNFELITGIPHEVDHIVPLNGEHVSGLHVPWNLQILTKSNNRKKSNRYLEQ